MFGFKFGFGFISKLVSQYLINSDFDNTYQAQEYKTDGVELVVGGSFNDLTDLDGWVGSHASGIIENNAVRVNGEGTIRVNQNLYSPEFVIEVGETYLLKTDILEKVQSTGWNLRGLKFKDTGLIYKYPGTVGSFIYTVEATSSIGAIGLHCGTAITASALFDNVSVQKVIQLPNEMYSTNSGTGTDLQLYSGQGLQGTGTNQYIASKTFGELGLAGDIDEITISAVVNDGIYGVIWNTGYASGYAGASLQILGGKFQINSNSSENTILETPYEDGEVVCTFKDNVWSIYINGTLRVSREFIYTTPFTFSSAQVLSVGAYRQSTQYFAGILKDLYVFNDTLTQTEITKYSTNPNGFFQDVRDGVIDNCVLNMPMDGVDKYLVDYANYSEGANDFTTFNILGVGWTDNLDGSYSIDGTNLASSYCTISDGTANEIYLVSYTISNYVSGDVKLFPGNETEATLYSGNGDYFEVVKSLSTTLAMKAQGVGCEFMISNIEFKPLSGIHEITNYTDSCRDNAKQLPYGTQEANFLHTDIGIPLRGDISEYFESSEWYDNYGDTGWIPSADEDWSIECVIEVGSSSDYQLFGKGAELSIGSTAYGSPCFIYDSRLVSGNNVIGKLVHMVISFKSFETASFYFQSTIKDTRESLNSFTNLRFILGIRAIGYSSFANKLPVKLFKVHQKALTQEEVTKAYNDAVNKGLLAPDGALTDSNGNIILDEDGNYILTTE